MFERAKFFDCFRILREKWSDIWQQDFSKVVKTAFNMSRETFWCNYVSELVIFSNSFSDFCEHFFQTSDKITCAGLSKLLSTSPEDRFEDFVWNKHRSKRIFATSTKMVPTFGKRSSTALPKLISSGPKQYFDEENKNFWLLSDLKQNLIRI